jgi:hypothetical protein
MRLAGILDDNEILLLRQLQDRVHIGRLPVEVDGTNRP